MTPPKIQENLAKHLMLLKILFTRDRQDDHDPTAKSRKSHQTPYVIGDFFHRDRRSGPRD